MMPTVEASTDDQTQARDNANKRVRINTSGGSAAASADTVASPPSILKSGAAKNKEKTPTPLTVALKSCSEFIESLDEELKPYMKELLFDTIKKYSSWFYKNSNLDVMSNTEDYVPKRSKFKHPLTVVAEVKKSKDFIALDDELSVFLEDTHKALGQFVIRSTRLNVKALKERVVLSFITLLVKAARLLLGECDFPNYTEYQAIIDLLTEKQDDLLSPMKISAGFFLKSLTISQKLESIPVPTVGDVNDQVRQLISRLNGPSEEETARREAAAKEREEKEKAEKERLEALTRSKQRIRETTKEAALATGATDEAATAISDAAAENFDAALPAAPTKTPNASSTPAAPLNTAPHVTPATARNLNNTFNGDADMEEDSYMAVCGGAAHLRAELLKLVSKGLGPAFFAFDNQVRKIERIKRITKIAKTEMLSDKASKVSAKLSNESAAPRPVLEGLIDERVAVTCKDLIKQNVSTSSDSDASTIAKLEREMQSVKAKLANVEKNNSSSSKKAKGSASKGRSAAKKRSSSPHSKGSKKNQKASRAKSSPSKTKSSTSSKRGAAKANRDSQKDKQQKKKKNYQSSNHGKRNNSTKHSR